MEPVLTKACQLDIAANPAPEALFEAGNSGFQIWCTPDDHPKGWDDVEMTAGAFAKPCEYVASVWWGWDDATQTITHLYIETDAYAFQDLGRTPSHNRPQDIAWAKRKIRWLFEQAGVPCPTIRVEA
jgi:hypothetical protein